MLEDEDVKLKTEPDVPNGVSMQLFFLLFNDNRFYWNKEMKNAST